MPATLLYVLPVYLINQNMKKYIIYTVVAIIVACSSCKKNHQDPTFPSPNWVADSSVQYPYSMTAVVSIPDSLTNNSTNDEVAAFINGTCRGVGVTVNATGGRVYFIFIKGLSSEQGLINFKYYNGDDKKMYETGDYLSFIVDDNYGTPDVPKRLNLQVMK